MSTQNFVMRILLTLCLITMVLGSSITNGTCYWKAGEEADEIYSPCGNTIDGTWPCCQLGDKCNNYNTCTWNSGTGKYYTYVAGCTDPTYQNSSCPYKGEFSEHQWVGLTWKGCDKNEGQNNVDWVGCNNDGNPEVRISSQSEGCVCQDDDEPLLDQVPNALVAMGYLPKSKMGEITWEAGWERTDPVPSSTATSGSSVITRTLAATTFIDSSTISSPNTARSTATDSNESTSAKPAPTSAVAVSTDSTSNPLSTGTKIGVGLSATFIGLFACAFVVVSALRYRKKLKERRQELDIGGGGGADIQDQEKPTLKLPPEPAMLDAESTQRSSAWSGEKPELPGSPPNPSINDTNSPIYSNPTRPEDHVIVYRPFRYQSAEIGWAVEMPPAEAPAWPAVDYATYRVGEPGFGSPVRDRRDKDGRGGVEGPSELPG